MARGFRLFKLTMESVVDYLYRISENVRYGNRQHVNAFSCVRPQFLLPHEDPFCGTVNRFWLMGSDYVFSRQSECAIAATASPTSRNRDQRIPLPFFARRTQSWAHIDGFPWQPILLCSRASSMADARSMFPSFRYLPALVV
ncbi:hypothetical protein AVEN_9461-1 [Araneus ventricosus]|uniref:Uncharacterized protein n=1 Tax=Araneus ventricosus TaxID=182803 RepID=A0A4Y2NFL7_ARAVE|nr:hypothetical protein AVEN_9461-1 [Araneus ventricosus]